MLYTNLKNLDVVNVNDGNKVGKISDIEIDCNNGIVASLTILTVSKVKSFFRGESTIVVPWEKIVKIGDEVIIININK